MSDAPHIKIPPGHVLIEQPDGSFEVIASGEKLTKTIGVRVTPSEFVDLMPFMETFPNASMALGMRWLLAHPTVMAAMAERVAASRSPA